MPKTRPENQLMGNRPSTALFSVMKKLMNKSLSRAILVSLISSLLASCGTGPVYTRCIPSSAAAPQPGAKVWVAGMIGPALQPETEVLMRVLRASVPHSGLVETDYNNADYVLLAAAHGGGINFQVSAPQVSTGISAVPLGGQIAIVPSLHSVNVPAGTIVIPRAYVHLYLLSKKSYAARVAEVVWESHISANEVDTVKGNEQRFLECAWEGFPRIFKGIRYFTATKITSESGKRFGSPHSLAATHLEGTPPLARDLLNRFHSEN